MVVFDVMFAFGSKPIEFAVGTQRLYYMVDELLVSFGSLVAFPLLQHKWHNIFDISNCRLTSEVKTFPYLSYCLCPHRLNFREQFVNFGTTEILID